MWLIVSRSNNIVVASARTRREAYAAKRSMSYISEERFVVQHV